MTQLQNTTPAWPSVSNDTGTGKDGTPTDKSFFDTLRDAINSLIHSTTNPTVTPKATIDEVVTARGNLANLDARLSGVIDANGAFVASGAAATTTQLAQLAGRNCVPNDSFLLWPAGDAVAPAFATLTGAGASVSRQAAAKVGHNACQIIRSGADATLSIKLIPSSVAATLKQWIKGQYIGVGFWAYTVTTGNNVVRAKVKDTAGASVVATGYYQGDSAWVWVSGVLQLNASADRLELEIVVERDATVKIEGLTLIFSPVAPSYYIPTEVVRGTLHCSVVGTLSTGTKQIVFQPSRPGIVTDVQLRCETAPTGQAVIVDVNTLDGAGGSMTSMFSTRPQVAAAANMGGAAVDGATYARRCFMPQWATTERAGGVITADIDQVGSGTAGADLSIEIRTMQYQLPLEQILPYDYLGT